MRYNSAYELEEGHVERSDSRILLFSWMTSAIQCKYLFVEGKIEYFYGTYKGLKLDPLRAAHSSN